MMTRGLDARSLLFLCAAALAAACSGDSASPGDGSGDGSGDPGDGSGGVVDDRPELPPCIDNLDCRGGEVCRAGECRESCDDEDNCEGILDACDTDLGYCVECVTSQDCPATDRCAAGWCDFFCTSDDHCPTDRYCDFTSGACFEPQCFDDSECRGGERCSDLRCVPIDTPIDDTCRGDVDCDAGERCERGACVPVDAPECRTAADCDAGERCDAGTCVEDVAPDCTSDAQCRGGERCDGGACVPIEVPDCVDASDCDAGETCRDGTCEPVATTECVESTDCDADEECVFGTCVPTTVTPECISARDCGAGEVCEGGFCIDPTAPDNRCPVVVAGCRVRDGGFDFAEFSTASPGDIIECSGAGSYDADGTIERYVWNVISRPAGAAADFASSLRRDTSITIDGAGTWVFELSAFDDDGAAACEPREVTVEAAAESSGIRVELTWVTAGDPAPTDDVGSDVDIYLRDRSRLVCWSDNDVCHYGRRVPDWGIAGSTTDDPVLERDDLDGPGPEVIAYTSPPSGSYDVGVHYYNANGFGTTRATVRVFVGGTLAVERTRELVDKQFWVVGTITWPGGTLSAIDSVYSGRDTAACE